MTTDINPKSKDTLDDRDRHGLIRLLYKIHFTLLYVFLYSVFRNTLWFVGEPTEIESKLLWYLGIGFFVWFIGVNLFLFLSNYKASWNRKDYLSPYVLLTSSMILLLFELFLFDK